MGLSRGKNLKKIRKSANRLCLGCGQSLDKRRLIRIVRTPDLKVQIDTTGKKNGRGAYFCLNKSCIQEGLNKKCLYKSLKIEMNNGEIDNLQKSLMKEINHN